MPRLVAESDATGHNNLFALGAFGGIFILVTFNTCLREIENNRVIRRLVLFTFSAS